MKPHRDGWLRTSLSMVIATGIASCATIAPSSAPVDVSAELAEAKAVFERNIDAIQRKHRADYLANYRADEQLVRAGPEGVQLGFEGLATSTPTVADAWPSALEAHGLNVYHLAPGVVYGSYRYRVTINGTTTEGWSERVLIRQPDGWRIAVTTAFPK